jgi:Kelch motif protein
MPTPSAAALLQSPTPEIPTPAASPSQQPVQRLEVPLPVPLEESASAAAGGKLYVIGGFDAAGNSLRTVWVFDGSRWSAGPPLPLGLDHTSAATLNDQIYVAGGHSFGGDSARFFRLDGGKWTELHSMHHARGGHALLAVAGRLYVIGGNITGPINVPPAEVYDPATGAWSDLLALPAPRNHVAGFVLGADACVAGGRSPATSHVDCYNIESSAWVRLSNLPWATSGAGATAVADGSAVVMGGQDASETRLNSGFARLTASGSWAVTGTMLVPRHGFELAMFNGRAWACGGGSQPGLHPVATCTSVV